MNRTYSIPSANTPMIFDAPAGDKKILAQHFSDLHLIFLRELASFSIKAESTHEEHERLIKLIQELVKVRELLQGK